MISFDELSRKSKSQIRSSNELAEAFEFYFEQKFNRKPSFCCSFSDYGKLFKLKTKTMTTLKKYIVKYSPNQVLAYRIGKSTKRFQVKNATDELIDEFLKHHNPNRYPKAKQRIELVEKPKKAPKAPKVNKDEPKKDK